jgi:hypothetical protein
MEKAKGVMDNLIATGVFFRWMFLPLKKKKQTFRTAKHFIAIYFFMQH